MTDSAAMPALRVAVTLEQCWHSVPGGTAWAAIELVRALRERDDLNVVGVAARHRRPPPAAWQPPVEVRHLPLPRPVLYETWHAPGFRWPRVELVTGPVDVVHATAVAYPAARAPVVVTIHDLAFLHDARLATRHGHRFFRRGLDLARRHAALVVCPSTATLEECAAAGIDRARLRVVPWGVEPAAVTAEDIAWARRDFGLDGDYVLFAGTVEPRKNLPRLLDAYARLPASAPPLVVAGPRGWNETIAPHLRALGDRVRLIGFVDRRRLDALMAGASVFCYPSTKEGFGLPVLEAMAQGTPVVTSRGTATAEVGGDAVRLVDPFDVDDIAAGIDELLRDRALADRLRAAGVARAATFTWQRCADGTVAAYRDACS